MTDTNIIVTVGRLTRDCELKYTASGFAVCNFSIANNYSRKEGDGYKEYTNFFDVEIFGKLGESLSKYLTKGKQVIISGELRQERWEKEGTQRSRIKINANYVQLVGDNHHTGNENEKQQNLVEDNFKDDIPF